MTVPSDKVLTGKNGYLFLTNDTNRVLDQVQGKLRISQRQLWSTGMTHAARAALAASSGSAYHHVIVPDRETVLSGHLPDDIAPGRFGSTPLEEYQRCGASRLQPPFYAPSILRDGADEQAYFRRDTHWTFDGAWRYLKAMLTNFDIDHSYIEATQYRAVAYDNPGDLGSKVGAPPEPGHFRVPQADWARPVYDNLMPNVGRLRLYDNPLGNTDQRWLVLHDSFGEWLTLLVPALAKTTCFIHTPDFDEIFVRDFQPTRIFCFQIERFFVRPPVNGVDYDMFFAQQAEVKDAPLPAPCPEALRLLFPQGRPST